MSDKINSVWDKVYEAIDILEGLDSEERQKIGEKAMEYVGDYPIYGSTSNISYDEAILVALVLGREEFLDSLNIEEE